MTRQQPLRRTPAAPRPPAPTQAAVVALLRTADGIRRGLEAVIEPFGVTGQQYNVLRILRGARPDPLPTLAVAERMMEQTPGITRLLDRLEKKSLIARQRCVEDRRQVLCTITPQGLALLRRLDEPVEAADTAAVSQLNQRQRQQLIRLLDVLQSGRR